MFQDENDEFDWTHKQGSTTSAGTGPSSAKTGTYYVYTESTNRDNKDDAMLVH